MEIDIVMDCFTRFEDDGYKNWIKTQMGLQSLKLLLQDFIENETETYHTSLRNRVKGAKCQNRCEFKKGKSNQVPAVCERCKPWEDEILANSKGPLCWNNCKPYLWPEEKWEVAKVYMARGNDKHTSVDQFDISAFLNLMTNCNHFQFMGKNIKQTVLQVTNVRNQVMHTPSWHVKREELEVYLQRIRELGRALEGKAPNIRALDDDINQLQNIDFSLIIELTKGRAQGHTSAGVKHSENILHLQKFLSQEQQILKHQLESLSKCFEEDREKALTPEELQGLRVFLEVNKDLAQSLAPQWDRLREVQKTVEQHGQQINTLTGRVDVLEQNSPDLEFGTGIMMFKNHLFEETRKRGWPEPIFSEHRESTGYRGIVKVNGQAFTGSTVCGSIKKAHQDVAKKALLGLPNQTADLSQPANDQVEGEASNMPSNKLRKFSGTGLVFYGSVKVDLNLDICEEGHEGEAVKSAYMKLALLLGLQVSPGSSYEETALQYCQRRDVPLPQVISQSTGCTLKFSGPITYHDQEGSNKKKQAQQQAAKRALQVLCEFLGKSEVKEDNYIGALKELLEARGQSKPVYDVTDRGGGTGEERGAAMVETGEERGAAMVETGEEIGATMVKETGKERGAAMVEETGEERGAAMVDKEGGQMYVNQERKDEKGGASGSGERGSSVEGTGAKGPQPIAAPLMHSVQACEGLSSMDWTSAPMDTSKPMEVTPTQPEERSISGGKFICCVKVRIKKELAPSEASSQEGAVQEAYMSLLQALSLKQTTTPGGEHQRVLEFFKQSECGPPVEESDITAERKHRCKLSIMGELSFHSPKGAAKKQHAEHSAAKEALRHLEGLLGGNRQIPDSSENYKGRLQELVIKHGGRANDITYHTTDTHNTTAAGQMTKESRVVCGSNPRAEGSVKHAVSTETTPENRDLPQDERTSKRHSDILTGMKQWMAFSGLCGVECEDVTVEQRYEWRVCVGFEGFTLQIKELFGSKKEAIRHAYLRLGLAGQICQQDEFKSKEKMLTFFAKHSFSKPGETVHETNTGPSLTELRFSCSLTDITCVFTYCGEGSTEAAACLSAVQKALSCLCPLLGYASLSTDSVVDEHERLRTLLEKENLNLAKSVPERTQYRSSAKLKFKRYSVEGQQSKKDTKNQLSRRLLRLLGEDTASSNVSPRNTMDEWFLKNKLEKPQFEDGTFGTRVTFSAPVHCITDWQDSYEETERQLVKELRKKIQYLSDDSSNP